MSVPRAELLRRWAMVALGMFILGLAIVTLAPFRFQIPPRLLDGGPLAMLTALLAGPSHPDDVLNNLLLFLPFGILLAAAVSGRPRMFVIVGLAGTALACAIEVAQLFLPARTASLIDVVANLGGALLGALCLWCAERWAASRRTLVVGTLAYLAVALALAAQVQTAARLDSWDAGYRLLIGNEHNGMHPWAGTVEDLRVAAVGLAPVEAQAMLEGRPVQAFERALVLDYPLGGQLSERAGRTPDLVRRATEQGSYLRSAEPVAAAIAAIKEADAFTLSATVTPAAGDQRGPARIISLSYNNSLRNLTIGQQGDAVVVRLRTASNGPNGTLQQLRAPGLLAAGEPRRLLLTYEGARLALYADGVDTPWELEIVPEAVALSWLAPGEVARVVSELPPAALVTGGWLLVHGLIGLPLGLALAWSRGPLLPLLGRWGGAALLALLLPAGFELLLAAAGGRAVREMNIGVEALFALGALAFFGARAGRVLAPRRLSTAEVPVVDSRDAA